MLHLGCNGAALIEVLAGGHQLATERLHRRVLLGRVTLGNYDHGGDAVVRSRDGNRLAMISACGRHKPLWHTVGEAQRVHVRQSATRLKRPGRRVVLMRVAIISCRPFTAGW